MKGYKATNKDIPILIKALNRCSTWPQIASQ